MGLAVNSQTKTVIYNVYKYFRDRKSDRDSSEHRDDINVYKTAGAAVGVSHRTVMRIVKEANRLQAEHGRIVFEDPMTKRRDAVNLDDAIRAKYMELIRLKEKPTVNKIRIELLEDGVLLCSYDYMKLQLKRLGYRFRPARPRLGRGKDAPREDGAGTSGLEHVTVKVEPLEPGYDLPPPSPSQHLITVTDDYQYGTIRIKVDEHEFNDDT